MANTIVDGTNGLTFPDGSQMYSAASLGMRNKIINGAFTVNQRGVTAFPVGNTYGPDRWFAGVTGAAVTGGVATAATSWAQSPSYFQLNGAAGNTGALIAQRIESVNCRDLAGKTVAVSYWAYQSTGSAVTMTTGLSYANATDNFSSLTTISAPAGVSVPSGTWTFITAVFSVPAAATTGLQLILGSGISALLAGAVFAVGNVQLEAGSVSTPFENRPCGLELSLCHRYYETGWYRIDAYASAASQRFGSAITYAVAKRATPTVTLIGPGYVNASGGASDGGSTANQVEFYATASGAGAVAFATNWTSAIEL